MWNLLSTESLSDWLFDYSVSIPSHFLNLRFVMLAFGNSDYGYLAFALWLSDLAYFDYATKFLASLQHEDTQNVIVLIRFQFSSSCRFYSNQVRKQIVIFYI